MTYCPPKFSAHHYTISFLWGFFLLQQCQMGPESPEELPGAPFHNLSCYKNKLEPILFGFYVLHQDNLRVLFENISEQTLPKIETMAELQTC